MSEQTDPAQKSSRDRLIEAAWELAIESMGFGDRDGPVSPKIFDQITAARMAKRAGLTTGAFYNRWLDRDEFMEEFLDYALSIVNSAGIQGVVDALGQMEEEPPDDLVPTLVRNVVVASANAPAFYMQIYLWSISRHSPGLQDRLRAGYLAARKDVAELLGAFLKRVGRELRSPFTEDRLAALLIGIIEGTAIQLSLGLIDEDLAAEGIMAVVSAAAVDGDDSRSLTDLFRDVVS